MFGNLRRHIMDRLRGTEEMHASPEPTRAKKPMESTDKSSTNTKTGSEDWFVDTTDDLDGPGGFEFIGGVPTPSERARIRERLKRKRIR